MRRIGLATPPGRTVRSVDEALEAVEQTGYPAILRPSFTLGGTGGGIAYNREEFETMIRRGLELSPVGSVLVERSIIGWKEFELEVMRDGADNVVIVCSIENFDPMGVHTGDSITVAPAMTLTDREYQMMRDAAIRDHPRDRRGGRRLQHPVRGGSGDRRAARDRDEPAGLALVGAGVQGDRLSRSPASAPRWPWATGWTSCRTTSPGSTPASFEPVLDYVVVKIPRFAFEKFPAADPTLTTQMKSVGEAMAIGRTFKEAFQKGLRGLEADRTGWVVGATPADDRLQDESLETVLAALRTPTPERVFQIKRALQLGASVEAVAERTADRSVVPAPARRAARGRAGMEAAGDGARRRSGTTVGDRRRGPGAAPEDEAAGLLRPPARPTCAASRRATIRQRAAPARHPARLQDGGHLRRRVPVVDAVSLLVLRRGERGAAPAATGPSSSSAAGPTGSGRASSSTTAACAPRWRSASWATAR